jgi:TPR repeat protein
MPQDRVDLIGRCPSYYFAHDMSFIPHIISLVQSAKTARTSVLHARDSAAALSSMARDAQHAAVDREWERASQGHPEAQHDFAERLCEGRGLPRNYEVAVEWFRLAAEQGYAPAQCKLGMMLFVGRGIPQDRIEAYKWIFLAAKQGDSQAAKALQTAAERMLPEEINEGRRRARLVMESPPATTPSQGSRTRQ